MITVWDRTRCKLYGAITVKDAKPGFNFYSVKIHIHADASKNVIVSPSVDGQMHKPWFDDIQMNTEK
jgi:hypothetical protein